MHAKEGVGLGGDWGALRAGAGAWAAPLVAAPCRRFGGLRPKGPQLDSGRCRDGPVGGMDGRQAVLLM